MEPKSKPIRKRKAKAVKRGSEPTWGDVAKAMGINYRTLTEMRKRAGSPPDRDIEKWKEYLTESEAVAGRGKITVGGSEFTAKDIIDLKAKLIAAQVEKETASGKLKNLELRAKEEGIVPMSEARAAIAKAMTTLARMIENMPKSCAVSANPSDPSLAEEVMRIYINTQVLEHIQRNLNE